jgi:predicted dehydrogenase
MIRLAVNGADAELPEVAPRLRGGIIAPWNGDLAAKTFLESEATVFLGASRAVNLVERAVKAGKHVLLTAEGGISEPALAALTAAALAAHRQLAFVNPDRFLPSRQLVHQELLAGKLGEPGLVRLHRGEAQTVQAAGEEAAALPPPLIRDLDLARWLIGKNPNLVFAVESPAGGAENHGRFIQVHLGFPGQAMALLDYSSRLPAGEGYQSLQVIGSAGAAYANNEQNMQLLYAGGQPRGVKASENIKQMTLLLQDFLDGLAAKRDFSIATSAWQSCLAVASAVTRSLQSRQAVSVEGR